MQWKLLGIRQRWKTVSKTKNRFFSSRTRNRTSHSKFSPMHSLHALIHQKLILYFRLHFHQQYRRSGQVVRGCAPSSHAELQVAKKMPNGMIKKFAVRNFIIRECSCVNIFVCWVFTTISSPCRKLLCKQKNFAVN